ncbi:MAG: hypothetical protein IJW50_02430 [Clostridia bacterium]|nr:hypothetical protein [Clostridia bacterium]
MTKSGWYDIMDVQTEIRRMISALHNLDRKNAKKIEKATKTINENKKKLSKTLRIAKLKKKKLLIEEKFYVLGVGITFSLNISNKLINSVANFFIK